VQTRTLPDEPVLPLEPLVLPVLEPLDAPVLEAPPDEPTLLDEVPVLGPEPELQPARSQNTPIARAVFERDKRTPIDFENHRGPFCAHERFSAL
jgi:hypothetical protein